MATRSPEESPEERITSLQRKLFKTPPGVSTPPRPTIGLFVDKPEFHLSPLVEGQETPTVSKHGLTLDDVKAANDVRVAYVTPLKDAGLAYPFGQPGGLFLPVKNKKGIVKFIIIAGTKVERRIETIIETQEQKGTMSSKSIPCFRFLHDPPRDPLENTANIVSKLAINIEDFVQDDTTINVVVWCHEGVHRSVTTVLTYLMSFWLEKRMAYDVYETDAELFERALAMVSVMRPVAFSEPMGRLREGLWRGSRVHKKAGFSWESVVMRAYRNLLEIRMDEDQEELFS